MPVPVLSSDITVEVRNRFLDEEYAANPASYDERDVDRIRGPDDWFVQRFITSGDVDEAIKMMANNLKWRKEFGINDLTVTDFPAEFYQSGGLIVGGTDREGHRLVIIRVKLGCKCNSHLDEVAKKFLAYRLNPVEASP